jgi:hypothetical protein
MPRTPLERATLEAALRRAKAGDKAHLKRLGAVHTPLPLVHFALARIERALVNDFGLPHGLSSEAVQVLDPAVGTGIWFSALLSCLRAQQKPRALLGFETDLDALETARALLSPAAHAQGVALLLAQQNTLCVANPWLAGDQIRVVLGNPPWGARSLSRGLALNDAWLRDFHRDHLGAPLGERRVGVLSDDYVRFFRWALEQARSAPSGAIVCFVTNASYLDGPVHRGMRAALSAGFERIETFDLGGGSLRSRDASADEPIFPVRVAAALSVCVRTAGSALPARASYLRISGTREQKLAVLQTAAEPSHPFLPGPPWFRLIPDSPARSPCAGFSLDQVFPFHAEGVQTNRDALATAVDRDVLRERLRQIAQRELIPPASAHFDPERARALLQAALEQDADALIGTLAYRPLEERFYCKLAPFCHRPRPALERAVGRSALCLLSTRKEPGAAAWNMFALSTQIADSSYLSVRSACRTRVFPSHDAEGAPNLSRTFEDALAQRIGRVPEVRDVLLYLGGVLGAPRYREEQSAALKLDYPWIPWPSDDVAFRARVAAGALFLRALSAQAVSSPTLTLCTQRDPSERVSRSTLRWLSPYQLELCSGTEIGARNARPFRAAIGHHELVARAYRFDDSATIAEVHEACERSAMWVEAERAADQAYQPASSVRRAANVVAGDD